MSKLSSKHYQRLLGSALVGTSLFHLALPVLAEGTPAGTNISNTATGSYEDADGTDFTVESNTVTITVAEVAGIAAAPSGINDLDAGSIQAGDQLEYSFTVTNIGNETNNVVLPAPGDLLTTNFTVGDVDGDSLAFKLFDSAGNLITAGTGPGQYQIDGTTGEITVNGLAADDFITVVIEGTVNSGLVAGDPVSVTLGNTPPNDNSASTQNQPFSDATTDSDLYTANAAGDAPVNGVREASAFQTVNVGTQIQPLALATVLKTGTSSPGATNQGNDDLVNYNLTLRVESTSPAGNFQAADLEGTPIILDGSQATRVLVSDVIPQGTSLSLNAPPTAPTGWTVVYSTDDPATTIPVDSTDPSALPAANWTTTQPTDLSTVQRIGFILDGTVAQGNSQNFSFEVITNGLPLSGGEVYNIAQAFGQTLGGTDEIVYDESGDQLPNNFNDNLTPPDASGSLFDPGTDTGEADPTLDGIDPGGNTGTGPFGEVNQITITGTVGTLDDLFIGPNGSPRAIGPNDTNDDFTNKSILGPISDNGTPNDATDDTVDPDPLTFTNTVENPNGIVLNNVTVEPILPSQADVIGTAGSFGANSGIPVGTIVTIALGTTQTATYTYQQDATSGNYFWALTAGAPVSINQFPANGTQNYTVTIDLPAGTDLTAGYPVPIATFVDNGIANANGGAYDGENSVANVTINRVYTGFIDLVKQARILDANGNPLTNFSQTPTTQPQPGQFIEYRVRYQNISTSAAGTGNVTLSANNFRIVEHGTELPNNWALDDRTLHQQNTSATTGTVYYYQDGGAFTVQTAATPGTDPNNLLSLIGTTDPANSQTVDVYINQVGSAPPGSVGNFTFRRLVRNLGDTGTVTP